MELPDIGTIKYDVLHYIYGAKSATKQECVNSLPLLRGESIRQAIGYLVTDGLLVNDNKSVRLHYALVAKFDKLFHAEGEMVPSRVVNKLHGKQLTGYEASMRRNIRPDGAYPATGYISSGTSQTPFRGEVRK